MQQDTRRDTDRDESGIRSSQQKTAPRSDESKTKIGYFQQKELSTRRDSARTTGRTHHTQGRDEERKKTSNNNGGEHTKKKRNEGKERDQGETL